jgi:hypothetical protein
MGKAGRVIWVLLFIGLFIVCALGPGGVLRFVSGVGCLLFVVVALALVIWVCVDPGSLWYALGHGGSPPPP